MESILESESDSFWTKFTVVIASNVKTSLLIKLSKILFALNIPLVIAETKSFFGSLYISNPEHTIIETHPTSLVDLRLDDPWPELVEFSNQYHLDELDDTDLSHVPYIVILLKYLETWKANHSGQLPKSSKEKREFKALIRADSHNGDFGNFEEAEKNTFALFSDSSVPTEIEEILNDKKADMSTYLTKDSSKPIPEFWILVSALKDFVSLPESKHKLPVTGVLPDMTADTKGFVSMQKVYKNKATEDVKIFTDLLHKKLQEINLPVDTISSDIIETFCKNSRHIQVIHGTSFDKYWSSPEPVGKIFY